MFVLGSMVPSSHLCAANLNGQPVNLEDVRRGKTEMSQSGKEKEQDPKKEKAQKKMDGLSLAAHISITAGIASLFILPPLGLLLIPAGIIMGLIAWGGGKKRYENRRGRGLAMEGVILTGALAFLLAISFVAAAFSG